MKLAQSPGQRDLFPARDQFLPHTPMHFSRHGSRLSSGGPGQGGPTGTHPQQQMTNAPGAQWKNPNSLNNRTDACTSAVTAPLLHDSESKGWRKPVSNLDGSDPRAIYVTGVPEKSPQFLSGATLPRSGENFLLGPLPLVILTSRCKTHPEPKSLSAVCRYAAGSKGTL